MRGQGDRGQDDRGVAGTLAWRRKGARSKAFEKREREGKKSEKERERESKRGTEGEEMKRPKEK